MNRILIIDDNPAIHEDFRKILGGGGGAVTDISAAEAALFGEDLPATVASDYDLAFASQGEEGLRKVEAALAEDRPFAMAFVDVRMPPGWDGIETVSRIWQVARDLQVVICTAFSDYSWEEMIRKLGKTDQLLILKKPFDTVEVHQLAAAMTAKWELQRQQRSTMAGMETQMTGNTVQLSRSLSLTQATLDATTDGILVIDKEGKITGFNRQFVEIWNLPPSLIQSKHYDAMLNSVLWQVSDPQHFNAKFKELTADREGSSHDVVEFVDGRVFERFSRPQRVDDEIVGRVWSFRNVTEQRRAEGQVREQANMLNLASDAIFVCDLERRVKFWNDGCRNLFRWSAEEAHSRLVPEFLYPAPEVFDAALKTLLGEGEWNGEVELRTKVGETVIVNSRWTLVRDGKEKPKAVLAINTDITERRKMEARFLRTQRLESIGTLASGIAHDLNNILSPILISAPMLREGLEQPDIERIGRNIETSAQRGADIVKQLLTFGRGVEGERTVVPFGQMIGEVGRMAKETFPRHIRIEFAAPKDLWPVVGDPTHMHQVLLNLCINARDAMNAGGTLSIKAENCELSGSDVRRDPDCKPGRYLALRVVDTGMGIPQAVLEKIFDPFFTTKPEGKGTGLGLSTVLGIVRNHGGFVQVNSEVGRGSEFIVYLPAVQNRKTEAVEEEAVVPKGRGETLLLVDDEEGVLQATAAVLESQGYRVLSSADGIEALAVYSENQPDIAAVITDVMMPSMDGAGMTRVLRKLDRRLKIIATSGLEEDSRFEELHRLGIQAFIPKPFTSVQLLSTLRRVLDDSEATTTMAAAS